MRTCYVCCRHDYLSYHIISYITSSSLAPLFLFIKIEVILAVQYIDCSHAIATTCQIYYFTRTLLSWLTMYCCFDYTLLLFAKSARRLPLASRNRITARLKRSSASLEHVGGPFFLIAITAFISFVPIALRMSFLIMFVSRKPFSHGTEEKTTKYSIRMYKLHAWSNILSCMRVDTIGGHVSLYRCQVLCCTTSFKTNFLVSVHPPLTASWISSVAKNGLKCSNKNSISAAPNSLIRLQLQQEQTKQHLTYDVY